MECDSSPYTLKWNGSVSQRVISRAEFCASEHNGSETGVSEKVRIGFSLNNPIEASARITRYSASSFDPVETASSATLFEPAFNRSGIFSASTPWSAEETIYPVANCMSCSVGSGAAFRAGAEADDI